jgi:cytochrome c-type biogenesis protein CcmH
VTAFVLLCAVMVAAALACVAVPLLRHRNEAATAENGESPRSLPTALVWLLTLPLAAIACYVLVSNYPWRDPTALKPASAAPPQALDPAVEEMIAKLENRMQQTPGEVDGWKLLGRSYLMTNRPGRAVTAYQRAYDLSGGRDLEINLDLAEAMILADDSTLGDSAKRLLDGALTESPTNAKALWYSGVLALRGNDTAVAIERWSKLLEQNPPPEIRDILNRQLTELGAAARGTAGGPTPSTPTNADPTQPAGRAIEVFLDLDPKLRERAPQGSVLFVSARQPGIPGPPLAVIRTHTGQWPLVVTLSDANAMIAGRDLTSVDDVEVTARIAFGGTPVTVPGDLVGRAVRKRGETGTLAVTIDTIAP